jgi:hypothetical protein
MLLGRYRYGGAECDLRPVPARRRWSTWRRKNTSGRSPKLKLSVPVITPVFEDWKNGKYKIISFFAKRARGMMARYAA